MSPPLGIKTATPIRAFTGLADGPFLRRRPAAARPAITRADMIRGAEPWDRGAGKIFREQVRRALIRSFSRTR